MRSKGMETTALRATHNPAPYSTSAVGARIIGEFIQKLELGNIRRSASFITTLVAHPAASAAVLVVP